MEAYLREIVTTYGVVKVVLNNVGLLLTTKLVKYEVTATKVLYTKNLSGPPRIIATPPPPAPPPTPF